MTTLNRPKRARFQHQDWNPGYLVLTTVRNFGLELMPKSDVIVFGGGGYFNEVWRDAFPARIAELELAHASGTPYLILGPSHSPPALAYGSIRGRRWERNAGGHSSSPDGNGTLAVTS